MSLQLTFEDLHHLTCGRSSSARVLKHLWRQNLLFSDSQPFLLEPFLQWKSYGKAKYVKCSEMKLAMLWVMKLLPVLGSGGHLALQGSTGPPLYISKLSSTIAITGCDCCTPETWVI